VIVAYSLGSVVAYETLCANPSWSGINLVTLGSPLGIRRLVLDRLEPSPLGDKGLWPQSVTQWTNIADRGDVVALVKELNPLFGDQLTDLLVHNGAKAHDARPRQTISDCKGDRPSDRRRVALTSAAVQLSASEWPRRSGTQLPSPEAAHRS
jgi:hypothetical protein